MLSDDQIIEGCKKGKRHAYSALYKKYAAVLLAVCYRYTKSRMEAEDVLQEGFVKVFQKIGSFESRGSFEGWLKRVMVNTAINQYKAKQRQKTLDIDLNSKEIVQKHENDNEAIELEEIIPQAELMKLLQQLPDGYRMVFNMYAIEGLQHNEISEELNISVSTSKTQLFKARRWLRQKIEERQQKLVHL
ncbi:MAG: RNA polymerase sigma factor [Bacteroidales bacterium]|nr:RNA polymerase sigma factor [Bacteroidales bacterium]MCF6341363.1 RNA polymerase sigma factor [Bacteroidales bacterium]